MDTSEPVIIARVWADNEAFVIQSLLESYHIPSHYTSELPTRIYPVSAEGVAQIRIYVAAEHAQEAKEILEEHRRQPTQWESVEDEQ
jgi:hypothetical protein